MDNILSYLMILNCFREICLGAFKLSLISHLRLLQIPWKQPNVAESNGNVLTQITNANNGNIETYNISKFRFAILKILIKTI